MELHLTNRTIEDKGNQGHFSPRVHLISSVLIVKNISLWKLVLKDIWKALGCNKQMCWCPENYYHLWLINNNYLPCLSTIINIVSRRHGFPFLLSKMYVASLFGGFRFLFLVCGLSSWFKPFFHSALFLIAFVPVAYPPYLQLLSILAVFSPPSSCFHLWPSPCSLICPALQWLSTLPSTYLLSKYTMHCINLIFNIKTFLYWKHQLSSPNKD